MVDGTETALHASGNIALTQTALTIRNPTTADQGLYICTSNRARKEISLTIVMPPETVEILEKSKSTTNPKNSRARIIESKTRQVSQLTCKISAAQPKPTIRWLLNGETELYDQDVQTRRKDQDFLEITSTVYLHLKNDRIK